MKKREIGNLFLHIGVGGALAATVLWHPAFIIVVTFVYAWERERAQHRYVFTHAEAQYARSGAGKLYLIKKRSFTDFGWVTGHRIWEVFQWVIGAAVACAIWEILR